MLLRDNKTDLFKLRRIPGKRSQKRITENKHYTKGHSYQS